VCEYGNSVDAVVAERRGLSAVTDTGGKSGCPHQDGNNITKGIVQMDLGSGVAFGTLCVSVAAVGITAIRSKSNGNGKQHCSEHSGFCTAIDSIEKTLAIVQADIKTLLSRR
jgi:hypothetical protein